MRRFGSIFVVLLVCSLGSAVGLAQAAPPGVPLGALDAGAPGLAPPTQAPSRVSEEVLRPGVPRDQKRSPPRAPSVPRLARRSLDAGATADSLLDAGAADPAAEREASDAQVAADGATAAGPLDDDYESSDTLFDESASIVLPPAAPDPQIAPLIVERQPVVADPPIIPSEDRPQVVIGTLLGLLGLLALAYLGGHKRVQAFERRFGISQVITAGFPFVLLGLFARTPSVGLLSDTLLADLSPLLRIGLGCIGFVSGFRFSAQFRAGASNELVRVAAFATAVPFALVAVVSGATLLALSGGFSAGALRDPVFIRDALILGTAGAMTAKTSAELFRAGDTERVLARVLRIEEFAGIIGLAIIAAYFRPKADATWQLPGTAWLLLTVGLGATLGVVAYLIFRRPQEGPEFVVLTLGTLGFSSGIAGYLRLSPVVVAFIAGSCLAILPGVDKERIRIALRRLERPVYFLSLIVIGALWRIDDWRGWLLVPVFTAARFLGKRLGTDLAARYAGVPLTPDERQVLAVSPMGPLAIAIVVNAQLLYPGGSISPIVAAVIGGAIVTEVVVQLASRRAGQGSASGIVSDSESVGLSDPPEGSP